LASYLLVFGKIGRYHPYVINKPVGNRHLPGRSLNFQVICIRGSQNRQRSPVGIFSTVHFSSASLATDSYPEPRPECSHSEPKLQTPQKKHTDAAEALVAVKKPQKRKWEKQVEVLLG
jgi:hypothetical protein